MKKTLIAVMTAFSVIVAVQAQSKAEPKVTYIDAPRFKNQIYLYGEPKADDVNAEQWYEIEGRGQFVRNVKAPTMIPYLPKRSKANGAAIIIAPGGAFLHHTFGSGGYEAAEWFKKQGVATFILKYRVEDTPREEADYQKYTQEKMAGYNAESAPVESKADFIGSIYGQLVLRDMPEKVPPMFAAMSSDDALSGQSGFEVIQAWQKHGIVELHLYGLGGTTSEWDTSRTRVRCGHRNSWLGSR